MRAWAISFIKNTLRRFKHFDVTGKRVRVRVRRLSLGFFLRTLRVFFCPFVVLKMLKILLSPPLVFTFCGFVPREGSEQSPFSACVKGFGFCSGVFLRPRPLWGHCGRCHLTSARPLPSTCCSTALWAVLRGLTGWITPSGEPCCITWRGPIFQFEKIWTDSKTQIYFLSLQFQVEVVTGKSQGFLWTFFSSVNPFFSQIERIPPEQVCFVVPFAY